MITMLRLLCFTLLIQSVSSPSIHPDFSGTWALRSLDGDPGNQQIGSQLMSERILAITQTDKQIDVGRGDRKRMIDMIYLFGSKGSGNAYWDGKKLVISRTMELSANNEKSTLQVKEEWSLGSEGGGLIIQMSILTRRGYANYQLYYKKQ